MGLRAMHEASKQSSTRESRLQLIEEQSQTIAELKQRISELLSENSELVNELRSKSETIKSLNEKIGRLSESDKVLKQNAELKRLNELLRKEQQATEQRAGAMISSVKREYARKEQLLADGRVEAQRRTAEAEKLKQSMKADIQKQAKEMVEDKVTSLEAAYQAKTSRHYAYVTGVSLYAVLVIVLTAIRSEAFVSDFKTCFRVIWAFLLTAPEKLLKLAEWFSQLGDKIPQPIVAAIVHWLLWFIVVGVGIGAAVLLYCGIGKLISWYAEDYADNFSLGFVLVSLALSIFFAEEIKAFCPINLLLLLILTHVVYIGVRWYVKCWIYRRPKR